MRSILYASSKLLHLLIKQTRLLLRSPGWGFRDHCRILLLLLHHVQVADDQVVLLANPDTALLALINSK
jgi:hypothetical protein